MRRQVSRDVRWVVWGTQMLDDYLVLGGKNIEVRYVDGDKLFAEETASALTEAIASVSTYFSLETPFPPIRAILAPHREEYDRLVANLLSVKIEKPSHPARVAQPQKTDLVALSPSAYEHDSVFEYRSDEYRRLLFHEMTHMFEEYLAPAAAMETMPRWWSEGIAAYLSGQWKYEDQYKFRQPVLQGIKDKVIPDIEEIEASVELGYDWGWTIVMFIDKIYGRETIQRIVRECDNGDVFGMLGEDMNTFQGKWKEWLLEESDAIKETVA
jgi:hypothetical protein